MAAARAYKGTPFRHQGRSKTGIDCLGLQACALRDAGLTVRDATDYGRQPDIKRLRREMNAQAIPVDRGQAFRAGVLVLFNDPDWIHVGIMTGPRSFIHSRGPEGIGPGVVEHILDDQSWGPRLKWAWRHPGMVWEG